MTIEAWNILLSAVILVLLTGGGIWLKYVVEQQLRFKDTAIEALEGVIKLKDTEISSLKDDTAPAIAKSYAVMREHANQTTDDYRNLAKMYQELMLKKQLSEQVEPGQKVLTEGHGLVLASDILHKHIGPLLLPDGKTLNPLFEDEELCKTLVGAVLDAGIEISTEGSNRSREAGKILAKIMNSQVYRSLDNQE